LAGSVDITGLGEALETVFDILSLTRGLTNEEVAEARKVFGDSINYNLVRVNSNSLFNTRAYVFWGYTINLPLARAQIGPLPGEIPADSPELTYLHTLIHELTHVWQYETMGSAYLGALGDTYDYGGLGELIVRKNNGFKLTDFNEEQEGEVLRHYYIEREAMVSWLAQIAAPRTQFELDLLARQFVGKFNVLSIYAYFVKEASSLTEQQLRDFYRAYVPSWWPIVEEHITRMRYL
jgi:hypothetical protein